jgi:alpha-glucosidase
MRGVLDAYPSRVLIGEVYLPFERLVAYYGHDMRGAHLPFNFQLIFAPWNAPGVAQIVEAYEAALPKNATPNWVLGNHDQKRIATRVGASGARLAALLLLTLRGTAMLYYGDELGLQDVSIPPDRVQDPWEKNEAGFGHGRDPARTPMPWDNSPNAGFTTGIPWLPVGPDHEARNVAAFIGNPASILNLYRRLIKLRREHTALSGGDFATVQAAEGLFAFERNDGNSRLLIVLNFAQEQRQVTLPADADHAMVLLSTCLDRDDEYVPTNSKLRPAEGMVLKLIERNAS